MIIFQKISWKNFLSTGAGGNELSLNQEQTTLITGKNGGGKSTLLCAICFALFNKPFRNVNKGQLLNSINQKNCVVELEFFTNNKLYKVIRGIKPNIFEIWVDGELLNKEAASRDYQKILEQQIIKTNYKTFTQTDILGSASYVPFMELSPATRREIIEDILDISIFSSMNVILKQEFAQTKSDITKAEYDINLSKQKIESQNQMIQVLLESKDDQLLNLNNKKNEYENRINVIQESITNKTQEISNVNYDEEKHKECLDIKDKLMFNISNTKSSAAQIYTEIEFFETHDNCSLCAQSINHTHKTNILDKLQNTNKSHDSKISLYKETLEKINVKNQYFVDQVVIVNNLKQDIVILKNESSIITNNIKQVDKELIQLSTKLENIEIEKQKLKQLSLDAISLVESRRVLLEQKDIQEQALLLLKDNGIKTSIIKEYIPIINQQINKYLSQMEFFCNFELDETFTEKIKSRDRDEFTYSSFSEGEKQRINLAIMLTFRHISKMKNSLNTNLLILDEIFSSSLDSVAVNFLIDMLKNLPSTNVFVITHHGEPFIESFDKHIQFEKKNNFSIIKEIND